MDGEGRTDAENSSPDIFSWSRQVREEKGTQRIKMSAGGTFPSSFPFLKNEDGETKRKKNCEFSSDH